MFSDLSNSAWYGALTMRSFHTGNTERENNKKRMYRQPYLSACIGPHASPCSAASVTVSMSVCVCVCVRARVCVCVCVCVCVRVR